MLEDMTATIDIKGTDVLNGLKILTENSDIILEPLPSWATKGKNEKVVSRKSTGIFEGNVFHSPSIGSCNM